MIFRKEPLIKKLSLVLAMIMSIGFSVITIINYYFFKKTSIPNKNVNDFITMNIIFSIIIIFLTIFTFIYIVKFFIQKLEKISAGIDKMIGGDFTVEINFDTEGILSRLESQFYQMGKRISLSLEDLSNEKENIKSLVTDISHQIKTPLASIRMFNSILLDDELNLEEEIEFLEKTKYEIEKLQGLSDSLIKVSRMEVGVIELKKESCDIKKTILEAVNGVYLKAFEKNIEININKLDSLEIKHDERWTKEAIFNVLENAVKYTEANGQINIYMENLDTYIRIDISDSGIGIPKNDIHRVFERFYRGSGDIVESLEGSGIGLYLARKIIEEQEGSIIFTSKEGVGTKFSIILTLQNCKKPLSGL